MYLWTRHIIYSVVHDLSEIQTDSQVLCQSFIYRQSLDKDAQLRIRLIRVKRSFQETAKDRYRCKPSYHYSF